MKMKVVKRDGKKSEFNSEKIAIAIRKGFNGAITQTIYTEEDQMEGMVRFKDTEPVFDGEDGEYTFRYMNYDVLDAHVSRAKPGDLYNFAFPRKDILVPLERVEKESELEKWKEIFFG